MWSAPQPPSRFWEEVQAARDSTSRESFEQADHNCREKSSNKQIGRRHEDQASFQPAAEIDEGDEHQNSEAEGKCMRLQTRHRGNQRADTRGNAHCNHQYVVNHQSGGSKQTGGDAEILPRDGGRPTTAGIGLDRLTVCWH
jgi:hypothetical protein